MTTDPTIHFWNDLFVSIFLAYVFTTSVKDRFRGGIYFVLGVLVLSGVDGAVKMLFGGPSFDEWIYQAFWIILPVVAWPIMTETAHRIQQKENT
jgi:hypothetical protein